MGESRTHMTLVQLVLRDVLSRLAPEERPCVFVDTPETGIAPPVVGGYHPDVYFRSQKRLIIGEAKTGQDLYRPHSLMQLAAYYDECHMFSGDAEIVVAVPWTALQSTLNFYRRLTRRNGSSSVSITILDERGKSFGV